MLARISNTNSLPLLLALGFILTGCGGSDTSNQRRANSNPFAPANDNSAPAQPQSSQMSQTRQPQASPSAAPGMSPKVLTEKKPEPVESGIPSETNIISETSKRTLDSESPGVAIIVRGVSGNEPLALPILQQNLRSSSLNPLAANLQKQDLPAESTRKDLEHFVFDKQLVLVVRPVPADLFAFAQTLKWGKVKEIDLQNRIITVDAQLQELNSLALRDKAASMQPASPANASANSDPLKNNPDLNSSEPAMKQPENKSAVSDKETNDRDLKPRSGEETIDWALRVIAGTSPFAHDTACKKLASMKPDSSHLQQVSSVLAATLPLAKEGFRMKEHVNAMAVWYTDEATLTFAALLSDERSVLVREEIIELLPTIRSETTAEVLVGRLSNREDMKDARRALRFMGEIAEKPVIKLLNHPDSSLRIEACNILQSIGTQEALDALQKQAEIEDSIVVKQLLSKTQTDIKKKLA
ncbi:MAG: HEAT repeat domain-containing protein, partial [Planctomycetota bacterium]